MKIPPLQGMCSAIAQSVEHQTFKATSVKGSEGQGLKSLIGRNVFHFSSEVGVTIIPEFMIHCIGQN